MRKSLSPLGLVCVLMIIPPWGDLFCQDKPDPPPRAVRIEEHAPDSTREIQLPTISLPEFDIAGSEVISLNSSSKGVLQEQWRPGSSTVRETPGDRELPIAALGSAVMAGLPDGEGGFTGRMSGGYRSFQTPFIGLWLGMSSRSSGFLVKSGYKSSAGHVPNADFKEGDASVATNLYVPSDASILGDAAIQGNFGFQGKTFRLYGSSTPDIQRMLNRVQGNAVITSKVGDGFTYDAGGEFESFSLRDERESKETEVGLRFRAERAFDATLVNGVAEIWRDFYLTQSTDQDPFLNILSFSVQHPLTATVQLNGGISFYHHRGSDEGAHGQVYPYAGISWSARNWLTLVARFAPYVLRSSLSKLIERSPYVNNDVPLRHPDFFTNATLGAVVELDRSIRGSLTFRYQQARNFPLFVESGNSGIWNVQYMGTTHILGLDGEASVDLTELSRVSLSLLLQDVDNSVTGFMVPYSPGTQLGAHYRHIVSTGITLAAGLQVRGSQFTNLNNTNSLPAFVLCDVTAEYEPIPRFFVGLTVDNLLDQDQEVWRGYVGLPRTVTALVRYNW